MWHYDYFKVAERHKQYERHRCNLLFSWSVINMRGLTGNREGDKGRGEYGRKRIENFEEKYGQKFSTSLMTLIVRP